MKNQNQRIQSENSEIEAQPQFEATPYDEFIEGFAEEAPILITCDAEKEWDDFSQQLRLSIEEILALEDGGYEAGIERASATAGCTRCSGWIRAVQVRCSSTPAVPAQFTRLAEFLDCADTPDDRRR